MAWSENYNSFILIRASKNSHLRSYKVCSKRKRSLFLKRFGSSVNILSILLLCWLKKKKNAVNNHYSPINVLNFFSLVLSFSDA